jgi:hypothetical protein
MFRTVSSRNRAVEISAHLQLPEGFTADKQYPALVGVHPADVIEQRHHPLAGSRPVGPFAVADVQLAERTELPADVSKVQAADLVDPQPGLGHQPGAGVVAGGRGVLTARGQAGRPVGKELGHLRLLRRDPQPSILAAPGHVHLIERALNNPPGQGVQFCQTGTQIVVARWTHRLGLRVWVPGHEQVELTAPQHVTLVSRV